MDLRLRGVPGAILRRVRARAAREGTDLRDLLIATLTAYADETDPQSTGARGGQASAAALTREERSAKARAAVQARWAKRSIVE